MKYKKGDRVVIKDGSLTRNAVVVQDGIDTKNRVRVRPENMPMDMSITLDVNSNLHIIA